MFRNTGKSTTFFILCLLILVTTACSSPSAPSEKKSATAGQTEETGTHIVTDAYGKQVEIPKSPKRIVYTDNTVGDLLLFGIKPVGLVQGGLQYSVYKDEVKDIADISWPPNMEKLIELKPDLIITSTTDEKYNATLSKIAPVILTNEWDPMPVRIKRIGDWFGYEKQAEDFLTRHNADIVKMWKAMQLDGTIKKGETASVYQYMVGQKRLSVYTTSYLTTFVYHKEGFQPTPAIQKMIENPDDYGYANISAELLPKISGDRIFIVYFDDAELAEVKNMIKGPIWSSLPAIKADKVYFIHGGLGITTDPLAREELIKELPVILKK
ncbi:MULTISPECIES: ABC transporter substrate-binding protein [unclassified Paenibacillus]|uniref:ABC transporter substrate-binding protein n=1 Tax=unclassified Paenibacillus TaxID=185978 RepID=UPI003837D832